MTLPTTYQEPPVAIKPSAEENVILLINSFKQWLTSKSYSPATIRNYLSDLNSFFQFSQNSNPFLPETISSYLKKINSDSNYRRYLSSLSKFIQFAQDQGLTKTNPLKAALRNKKPTSDEIINQYSEFLTKKNFSNATIKNYLNDIKQFIDWSQNSNFES